MDIDKCYGIYAKAYTWANIGKKLTSEKLNELSASNTEEHIAQSIGAQDAKLKAPVRSKVEFEQQLKRLLGIS